MDDSDLESDAFDDPSPYDDYEDSEQFDEEEESWADTAECDSIDCLTWGGWKCDLRGRSVNCEDNKQVLSLMELCSQVVAQSTAFEELENHQPPVPEDIQLRVAFWSFPRSEDEVRMYSCLANGTPAVFLDAENIIKFKLITDVLQIGFHLTAKVKSSFLFGELADRFFPSVTFDRCYITSCQCTCKHDNQWCSHVIALCLKRIMDPSNMKLCPPVSDSLARLKRDQLQKFVQYLISELPQQVLPTAQRLLQQLLHQKNSPINLIAGAPDPTAGGSLADDACWVLDKKALTDNIKKLMGYFTGSPQISYVDPSAFFTLSYSPPAALEWSNIIKPLQKRQPDGLANLLSITRDMFARKDPNATVLLDIITEEFFYHTRLIILWFSVSVDQEESLSFNLSDHHLSGNNVTSQDSLKYAATFILDDIALIWKLGVLGVEMSEEELFDMEFKFQCWQDRMLEIVFQGLIYENQDILDMKFGDFGGFSDCVDASDENVAKTMKILKKIKDFDQTLFMADDFRPQYKRSFEDIKLPHLKDSQAVIHNCNFGYCVDVGDGTYYASWEILFLWMEVLCFHGEHERGILLAVFLGKNILKKLTNLDVDKLSREDITFVNCLTHRTLTIAKLLINRNAPEWWDLLFELCTRTFDFGCAVPTMGSVDQIKEIDEEFQLYGILKELTTTHCKMETIETSARKIILKSQSLVDNLGNAFIPYIYGILLVECLCGVDVPLKTVAHYIRKENLVAGPEAPADNKALGFELAIVLLGTFYPRVYRDFSMYCEMIRRLRHEFALHSMLHYKKQTDKIKSIMVTLLNPANFGLNKNDRGKWERRQNQQTSGDSLCCEDDLWDVPCNSAEKTMSMSSSDNLTSSDQRNGSQKSTAESSVAGGGTEVSTYRDPVWPTGDSSSEEDWDTEVVQEDQTKPVDIATTAVLEEEKPAKTESPQSVPENEMTSESSPQEETDPVAEDTDELSSKTGNEVSTSAVQSDDALQQLDSKKTRDSDEGVALPRGAIEAESFSLFELGKEILSKINVGVPHYGLDGTAENRPAPSRLLHMSAFEIVVCALRLQNLVSRNWMSRTYSMHFSWIETQARDIGTPAVLLLKDQWEGVLTPSEVVVIAEKVTRSSGAAARRASAELALSCLPQAHTLNLGSLQVAITLCREQGPDMLEKACLAIEKAATNCGLDPSLLFLVARQWDHIHSNAIGSLSLISNPRQSMKTPLITPEQFVQQQMHRKAEELLEHNKSSAVSPTKTASVCAGVRNGSFVGVYPNQGDSLHRCALPEHLVQSRVYPARDEQASDGSRDLPRYSKNAFRLGMKAMEALALRCRDEPMRSTSILALPCDADDISWLCTLSASLGISYLKRFCNLVLNAVGNPLLLHELALEAGRHFAQFNPAQLASNLRSASVAPMVQKCLSMYTALVMREVVTLAESDRADFVELLRKTRSAFCMTPGGMTKFNDLLQQIRRQTARELWQQITTGLSRA